MQNDMKLCLVRSNLLELSKMRWGDQPSNFISRGPYFNGDSLVGRKVEVRVQTQPRQFEPCSF